MLLVFLLYCVACLVFLSISWMIKVMYVHVTVKRKAVMLLTTFLHHVSLSIDGHWSKRGQSCISSKNRWQSSFVSEEFNASIQVGDYTWTLLPGTIYSLQILPVAALLHICCIGLCCVEMLSIFVHEKKHIWWGQTSYIAIPGQRCFEHISSHQQGIRTGCQARHLFIYTEGSQNTSGSAVSELMRFTCTSTIDFYGGEL